MRFYLWFNLKSSYFKSMNGNEKLNFQLESFIGTVITRSFIENQILDRLKMFDLTDFDEKEFGILEDFLHKFKNGKLLKEINKIKDGIRKAKIKKYKENKLIIQENEININLNQQNINNLIDEDDIDPNELEKIEVEYKIKKGETEVNINTIKFKQFYYLLDSKLFKYYLNNAYLLKSILLKLKAFVSNNFDYFTYIIMIINHMYSCSFITMFYPLSIFCFALLENPRPKKLYWEICLYYVISILVIKFVFNLKIFSSIFEENQYSEFVDILYKYKIGIQYFEERFDKNFFSYIAFDSLLLLIFSINKNILIGCGIWDKREEQIENIFQATERVTIFKDLPSIEEADQNLIFEYSIYYNYYISKIFRKKNDKKIKDEEKQKEESRLTNNAKLFRRLFFYEKMKNISQYDEGEDK